MSTWKRKENPTLGGNVEFYLAGDEDEIRVGFVAILRISADDEGVLGIVSNNSFYRMQHIDCWRYRLDKIPIW
jgi:hypothetical protein